MKKLPSVSEMEHITSKEFGEHMDAILERVSKEDIALMIDHGDKPYVLCPARWFELPDLSQIEIMVKNSVRYVAEIDDSDLAETVQMVKELAPGLSPECMITLLEIIKCKISNDRGEWHEMEQALKNALSREDSEREAESP